MRIYYWFFSAFAFFIIACGKGAGPGSTRTVVPPPDTTATPLVFSSARGVSTIDFSGTPYSSLLGIGSGAKIVFAGGIHRSGNNLTYGDTAFIYDTLTQVWSVAKMADEHINGAIATADSKIIMAGGYSMNNGYTTIVDIYDVGADKWSSATLSAGEDNLAGASAGNIVAFAGGDNSGTASSNVSLCDASSGSWNSGQLSVARYNLTGAGLGSTIIFAGGQTASTSVTDAIDIYDTKTQTWSTAKLSVARSHIIAASAGHQIVFAGGLLADGNSGSSAVDIYNDSTGGWTSSKLTSGNGNYFCAASSGNLILFYGIFDNTVDIYNTSLSTWHSVPLLENADVSAAAATGDIVMFSSFLNNSTFAETYHLY